MPRARFCRRGAAPTSYARLAVVEGVETAAQCFAVDGDRGSPSTAGGFDKLTAWRRNAPLQRRRIDALQDQPQTAVGSE